MTYKANDTINEDNKTIIENYLNETLPEGHKAQLVLNSDGEYEVVIDGQSVMSLSKDTTLSEALQLLNSKYNDGKSLSSYSPSISTTRLRYKTGENYKIHIDEENFKQVMKLHKDAENAINEGKYDASMLTGELRTFYNQTVEMNNNPDDRIKKTSTLLNKIVTNVNYSLQAYENIDSKLGLIFNSIVNEIFSMNKYQDTKTEEFYNMDFIDREEYLNKLIDEYGKQLDILKKEYKEKYGDGITLSEEQADFVISIACGIGFNFENLSSWNNGKVYITNPARLEEAVNYIKENDVMTKLKKYSDGKSWHDSGMSKLNNHIAADYFKMNNLVSDTSAEATFLEQYIKVSGDFCGEINTKYGTGYRDIYNSNPSVDQKVANAVRERLKSQFKREYDITDSNGEKHKYNAIELVDYYFKDDHEMVDSINSLSNTIYNYKQYYGLMSYLGDMEGTEYLDYLCKDYSNLDKNDPNYEKLQYLDQKEIALYQMYMGEGYDNLASSYLNAMEDLINQRKGYEKAAEKIMSYGGMEGFLKSGMDGFTNGLEDFFTGISSVFCPPDAKRSSEDYEKIYILSLLNEENIYNEHMSDEYRTAVKYNYKILSSVGNQIIPTVVAFLPGGKVISPILTGLSSAGNKIKSSIQNGSSIEQAYLYGALSGVSDAVLNRCLSGIAGLNGKTDAVKNLGSYLASIPKQSFRTVVGTYLDGGLRSVILGEPFDMQNLTSNAFDAALEGAFSAAIMNGTNSVLLKLASGVTIKVSGKNYEEFCKDLTSKMYDTSLGKKVLALKTAGGEAWKKYSETHSNDIIVQMIDDYQYNHKQDMPIEIDKETAKRMGLQINDNEKIVYNPVSDSYQKVDSSGNAFNIPASIIKDFEGDMESSLSPRWQRTGEAKIIDRDENGNYVIETKYGEKLVVSTKQLDSQNLLHEIEQSNHQHEHELAYDYILDVLNGNEEFVNLANNWLVNPNNENEQNSQSKGEFNGKNNQSVDRLASTLANFDQGTIDSVLGLLTDDRLLNYYENARASNSLSDLNAYRTHGVGHIIDVLSSTIDAYHTGQEVTGGIIDSSYVNTMIATALVHDTGMMTDLMQTPIVDENGRLTFHVSKLSGDTGNATRDNHSFNSSINALVLSDTLQDYFPDIDPVEVALIAFAHSKSNSGVKDLGSQEKWSQCIQTLQAGIDEHNRVYPNNPVLIDGKSDKTILEHFQEKGLVSTNIAEGTGESKLGKTTVSGTIDTYEFTPEFQERLGNEGFLIRVGDANTNNKTLGYNQFGEQMTIYGDRIVTNPVDLTTVKYTNKDGEKTEVMATAPNGETIVAWDKLDEEAVPNEISGTTYKLGSNDKITKGAKYVLGENNQDYFTRVYGDMDGNVYFDEIVRVNDSSIIPYTTISAALERKGEIDTGGNNIMANRRFVIQIPENTTPEQRAPYELLLKQAPMGTKIVLETYKEGN